MCPQMNQLSKLGVGAVSEGDSPWREHRASAVQQTRHLYPARPFSDEEQAQ